MLDDKLHVVVVLHVYVSLAIERHFMSPCGITGISQSNNFHSGEMVISRNKIWGQQLVCGKSSTAEAFKETSLHVEVTVIMITIATSLQ